MGTITMETCRVCQSSQKRNSHSSALEPSGTAHELPNADEFNVYYALWQAAEHWESIQASAVDLATVLHRLLASSRLLTPSRLEATRRYDHYRLPTGVTLQLPCGWYLWVITLQYYAIDHASDLTLSLSP